jgi:hypothetical protein
MAQVQGFGSAFRACKPVRTVCTAARHTVNNSLDCRGFVYILFFLIHEGRQAPMGDIEPVSAKTLALWCKVFNGDKIE